jgi:hypothetical protein
MAATMDDRSADHSADRSAILSAVRSDSVATRSATRCARRGGDQRRRWWRQSLAAVGGTLGVNSVLAPHANQLINWRRTSGTAAHRPAHW